MGSWRKVCGALVVTAVVAAMVSGAKPSSAAGATSETKKILALLPMPSKSHQIFFTAVLKALLDKGHHITLVTSIPPAMSHPNQRVIDLKINLDTLWKEEDSVQPTSAFDRLHDMGFIGQQFLLWNIGEALANLTLHCPEVLSLKDVKHDLVITEAFFFQEALLGFADHYQVPSVVLNPFGSNLWINDLTGGAINPSYVPNALLWMTNHMTLYERLINTLYAVFELVGYHGWFYARQNAVLHQAFPNAPPLYQVIRNISLTMINNQAALSYPVPLAPTVVEVGGIHLAPAGAGKPLPPDLKKWLDTSPDGFVYFSMGSNLQVNEMSKETIDKFLTTFGSLKQKVLIKWDAKIPSNAPANCRFEPWLPQQQVLAHPNARVFVTHGGLLSTQEAVYHAVPVVGIPIFGDQFVNMRLAANKGIGVMVSFKGISVASLAAALDEVLHNPAYREKTQRLSLLFRSQPQAPLEKAMAYIDMLFKWGNTDHLRPSAVDLPWYQLILLDVFAVIFLGLYIAFRISRGVVCFVASCLCGSSKKAAKRTKKD